MSGLKQNEFVIVRFKHVPYYVMFRYKKKWWLKLSHKVSIISNGFIDINEGDIGNEFKYKILPDRLVAIERCQVDNPREILAEL